MKYSIKGLRIGCFVITTEKQLDNIVITTDGKEIWKLFIRAIEEGKINIKTPLKGDD